MEIREFINNFAEQFDEISVEELSLDTKFKQLDEWSSIVALSIIAMADEEYGVTLVGEDIRKSETIQDLFTLVKGKIQ